VAIRRTDFCATYSVTKGQRAIREFTGAMHDRTGNLPPLYGIFPDNAAQLSAISPRAVSL
jgi:hypothetical protein